MARCVIMTFNLWTLEGKLYLNTFGSNSNWPIWNLVVSITYNGGDGYTTADDGGETYGSE